MTFRILALGDIVSQEGVNLIAKNRNLQKLKDKYKVDFVIANAENASPGNGLKPVDADTLINAGCDVITGGNHILRHPSLYPYLDDGHSIIRPANFPANAPGYGYIIQNIAGIRVLAINLIGCVFMDNYRSPFDAISKILIDTKDKYDISILDIHAEATSEKIALAKMVDGKISAVFGTHTHVQTSDATILQNGTGYITDLGMCGSMNGVLGVKTECIIHRFTVGTPITNEPAIGNAKIHGAIIDIDTETKKTIKIEAIIQ